MHFHCSIGPEVVEKVKGMQMLKSIFYQTIYRWQCHEETQEIILDFITNYHFPQILMLQFTQSPPCPQVVLPPTARWLEPLPISRRSLKLETFSLLQVGKMTSLHILCINSHNQYQNLLFEIIFSLSSFQRSVLVLVNARQSFQLFEKTPPLVLRLCKVVIIANMAVMMLLVVLTKKNK